jgi:glycosyltransferase involved in cell wall biosynthesis
MEEKFARNIPVKILFVHSSSEMYGSDRCLYELVKRIDKGEFVPVVVLPFEGELSKRFRVSGITVYITDPWVLRKSTFRSIRVISYLLKLPVSVLKLIRIIRKERISVVYSNTSVVIGSGLAAFIMRRQHICHIRELYDDYPLLSRFYRFFLCRFSQRIIAISNAAASFVNPACPKKLSVVYDGIALDRFVQATHKIPDTLSEWKRQERIVVSNIGRVSPIKGQELFVTAAKECAEHDSNLRFLIIGDVFKGNEQFMLHLHDMVNTCGMQDVLLFTGFRDDVDSFIFSSDLIVLSTIITEGLGQVVMEGMTAGKVVIAPDKGGPVELIEDGVDGILYNSGNHNALAEAVLKAAGDPALRKSIGEKAKSKAGKQFGIQNNIAAIEQVIKQTITHRIKRDHDH